VDPPDVSKRLRDRLSVRFTFLSDPAGELLDELGIRHREGRDGTDIAYPTAVLVDADGLVRWIYQSDTYRQRARPEEVLAAIAALDGSRLR
jgi:peroxiredoxin